MMVSPDNPFLCDGLLTQWKYRSRKPVPFKAIVWRHVPGSSTQFQIVGINVIPAKPAGNEDIVYFVPENERIAVKAGDMIGWAYESEGPFEYTEINARDTPHVYFSDLFIYDSLNETQIYSLPGFDFREYSILATVEPPEGKQDNFVSSTFQRKVYCVDT